MSKAIVRKKVSGMTSKVAFVALCTLVFAGCAQFSDSFGQLERTESFSRPYVSDSADSGELNHNSADRASRPDEAFSANAKRSLTLAGVRLELADGQITQ